MAYDATQKSNVLNKYFCSITKLNDDDAVLPDFHDRCENILSQVIVTEREVIDMLCTLNANNAVGPDIISNRMLVSVKEEISKIKVITKLPNSEQSYKGKVKTHNHINRQNQSTTIV